MNFESRGVEMAEENQGAITEHEIYTNKQIIYRTIKELWKLRKDKKSLEKLYDELDTSRQAYDKIIYGESSRVSFKDDLYTNVYINRETKFFDGFVKLEVNGITYDEWEPYLENKDVVRALKKVHKKNLHKTDEYKEAKKFERKLVAKLKNIPNEANVDINLFKLYQYFTENNPFKGNVDDKELEFLIGRMKKLDFTTFELSGEAVLDSYYNELVQQVKMINALKEYKFYKIRQNSKES